jgi:DNA-binding NarL/FixJ family response regulator
MQKLTKLILIIPDQELTATLGILEANGIEWSEIQRKQQHKTDARTAELVYGLYRSGLAVRDISRRTNVSRSTVSEIVRNPVRYGLTKKPLRRQGIKEAT